MKCVIKINEGPKGDGVWPRTTIVREKQRRGSQQDYSRVEDYTEKEEEKLKNN